MKGVWVLPIGNDEPLVVVCVFVFGRVHFLSCGCLSVLGKGNVRVWGCFLLGMTCLVLCFVCLVCVLEGTFFCAFCLFFWVYVPHIVFDGEYGFSFMFCVGVRVSGRIKATEVGVGDGSKPSSDDDESAMDDDDPGESFSSSLSRGVTVGLRGLELPWRVLRRI